MLGQVHAGSVHSMLCTLGLVQMWNVRQAKCTLVVEVEQGSRRALVPAALVLHSAVVLRSALVLLSCCAVLLH